MARIVSKKTQIWYISILLILFQDCWNIMPIGNINPDIRFVFLMLYIIWGAFKFKQVNYRDIKPYMKPMNIILLGIFLSMIPAYLYHGQPFSKSIFTYRLSYPFIAYYTLLFIRPSAETLLKSINVYTVAYAIALLIRIYVPSMIGLTGADAFWEGQGVIRDEQDEVFFQGFTVCLFSLFYFLSRYREWLRTKDLLMAMGVMLIFLFLQNRSTLFPATLLFAYSIYKSKSKYRSVIIATFIILGIFFFYYTADMWNSLFEETSSNLNDSDSNRMIAYAYYWTQPRPILNILLGDGNISRGISNYTEMLASMGIFAGDVGFTGNFFTYGILGVSVYIVYMFKGYFSKAMPFFMQLCAIMLFVGSFTIFEFSAYFAGIFFICYLYLYMYYRTDGFLTRKY